jgi:predicted HNH restriction endonuclease
MSLSRNSSNDARKVLERLLPERGSRIEILRFLADSIQQAHTLAEASWSLTLTQTMVRLNVGKIETLAIFQDLLHLVLIRQNLPRGLKTVPDIVWNQKGRTVYQSVPGSICCDIPTRQFGSARSLVRDSHRALIKSAGRTAKRTVWTASHSPGVLRYLEEVLNTTLPDPSHSLAPTETPQPIIGKLYSWKEVTKNWGGDETYLSKRGGRIVCATLDAEKNPDAPDVMVVGHKTLNKRRAEEFCRQKGPIPIFIKEAKNQWRYKGRYSVAGFITDPKELAAIAKHAPGTLSRVIFLQSEDDQVGSDIAHSDFGENEHSAPEGRKLLVQHLRRERNRGLVLAKKQQVRSEKGALACEICEFNFEEFFRPHVADFCEVHHRNPLSEANGCTETRLADLAIVCSNCHRALHLIKPMPSVENLRSILLGTKTYEKAKPKQKRP